MSIIRRIRDILSWVQKEPEIVEYVQGMEVQIEKLEEQLKFRREQDRILEVCPYVRGARYDAVNVPDWFQTKDFKQLGEDFASYVMQEAIPTQRQGN